MLNIGSSAAWLNGGLLNRTLAGAAVTLIYASRTHSQLAQVIRELKSTKYRPRMAVIGSRQQMCVHKDVRTLTGAAQNAACRARTASRSCAHHNELESFQMREPDFGR